MLRWLRARLDSYAVVLGLLVAVFLLLDPADVRGWRLVLVAAACLAIIGTYRASNVAPRVMTMVLVATLGGAVALVASSLAGSRLLTAPTALLLALLLLTGPGVILRRVLTDPVVTGETILGALCVYVYLGLIFAFVYGAVDAIDSADFFVQGESEPAAFAYFSFVTVTTLGYGDLTPATDLGRNLAVLEAVTGQIYLVTLVARLVGLFGARRPDRAAGAE